MRVCWRGAVLFFASLSMATHTAHADLLKPGPREKQETTYTFGAVRIVHTIDSRFMTRPPDYSIAVYRGDELRALYRGLSFDHIEADKDNRLFVGISNSGLPGTALVLFDEFGNLKMAVRHGFLNAHYCEFSVSLLRVWYDAQNPQITFLYNRKGLFEDVSLRGCGGKTLKLSELLPVSEQFR